MRKLSAVASDQAAGYHQTVVRGSSAFCYATEDHANQGKYYKYHCLRHCCCCSVLFVVVAAVVVVWLKTLNFFLSMQFHNISCTITNCGPGLEKIIMKQMSPCCVVLGGRPFTASVYLEITLKCMGTVYLSGTPSKPSSVAITQTTSAA